MQAAFASPMTRDPMLEIIAFELNQQEFCLTGHVLCPRLLEHSLLDTRKIAVMGESAGRGPAAMFAITAGDR